MLFPASRGIALTPKWTRDVLWQRARAVPSLDQRFADNKSLVDAITGQNLVTFTRASSGTYVDSQGVIRTATTNLLLRSEEFDDAAWGTKTDVVVTANTSGTLAPNGTATAELVTANTTNGQHRIAQTVTTAAQTYTFSVFAKAAGYNWVVLYANAGNSGRHFNLQTGTIGQQTGNANTAAIQSVGNGWYRCSIAYTAAAASNLLICNIADVDGNFSFAGNNTSGIYLWGAQLEQSSTVGEYIPTTGTINSAPRFDHAITSSVTNLLLRSEEFDNASWGPVRGTVSANQETAPSGAVTADKLIAANGGADGQVATPATITSGATVTGSVYVKAGGFDRLEMVLLSNNNTTPYGRSTINPNTGAITTAASASNSATNASSSVQALGNGWYRFSVTVTYPAVTAAGMRLTVFNSDASNGDGVKGIYLWGAQLEQSSTAGEYVQTTSAPATASKTESLGLLVEEQRTNSIRNNTMVGAVAGTPGTLPANWFGAGSSGLARQVIGTGFEDGIPYIDVRYFGTTTSALFQSVAFEVTNQIAATQSSIWTSTAFVKLAGGSLTNITAARLVIDNYNSSSVSLGQYAIGNFVPTTAALITQRYSVSSTSSTFSNAATAFVRPYLQFEANSGVAIDITFRIGLPQIEQGAFATSVIPTTTAAVTRSADVASITGSNFGTTRTNLLVRSEEFDQAPWGVSNTSVTANAISAPNGSNTADKLVENTANGTHRVALATGGLPAGTYTFSVYLKKAERSSAAISLFTSADGERGININLSNGTATSFASPAAFSIVNVGGDWYRASVSLTVSTAATVTALVYVNVYGAYTGDGTSGIYLWGAQLEVGAAVTPYIQSPSVFVSRASSGTYIGGNGVLQTATTNLQINSENIASLGTLLGSTVTSNATVAPDGQTTADKLIEDTSTAGHQVSGTTISWLGNTTYTVSVYAKPDTRTFLTVAFGTSSNWVNSSRTATFNLLTGTVSSQSGTPLVASIQTLSNGWYRCSISATTIATPVASSLVLQLNNGSSTSYTGDGTSGLFLWGVQLEQSSTVGEYIPTASTINSAARYDHDPISLIGKGLLLEESRTNLVRNNTMVGAVAGSPGTPPTNGWVITNNATYTSSIIGTGIENGINYIDVQYVIAAGAAASGGIVYADTPAATASTIYTGSYYLKLVSGNSPQVRFVWQDGVNTINRTFFSLTTVLTRYADTVTTSVGATLARFAISFAASPSGATFVIRIGLPQVEQGAFATSVIPTTTATVTRAADVSTSVATSVFESSWYRQSEGTVFAEARTNATHGGVNSFPRKLSISDGTNNNIIEKYYRVLSPYTDTGYRVDVAGVIQAQYDTNDQRNGQSSVLGYSVNNFALAVGGTVVNTDSSGTVPTTTLLRLGQRGDGSGALNGTIRRLVYFPVRLANQVLQRITQ